MGKAKQRKVPKIGAIFVRKYRKHEYRMEVVEKDGETGFKVGGKIFGSPSGAARHVTGGETNGWRFWKMEK